MKVIERVLPTSAHSTRLTAVMAVSLREGSSGSMRNPRPTVRETKSRKKNPGRKTRNWFVSALRTVARREGLKGPPSERKGREA